MKLRGSNHMHFIKDVESCSATQVLNVNRGRPALILKCVRDIYENAKKPSPEDEIDRLTADSANDVKVEYQHIPVVHRRTIKCIPEISRLHCSSGGESSDNELEDMTLKQIKESRKKRKRKHCSISKLFEETCPGLKQDYSKPQAEGDELDLTVPLSCWKSKLSKKKKAKRKRVKSCPPSVCEGVVSFVKSEELHHSEDFLQQKEDIRLPTDTKVAVSTNGYSDEQEIVCLAVDSSSDGISSHEVGDPELDYMDAQSVICVAGKSSFRCKETGSGEFISNTGLHVASECVLEAEVCLSEEAQGCLVDKDFVCIEPADSKSLSPESASGVNILETRDPEAIDFCDLSSNTISSTNSCSDIYGDSQRHSYTSSMSCQTHSKPEIEVSDIATCISLQKMESSRGGVQRVLEKGSDDDLPSNVEANAVTIPLSNFSLSLDHGPCSRSNSCSASVSNDLHVAEEKQPSCLDSCLASVNDSPTAEEIQQLLPTVTDAARDTSSGINNYSITDELESLPRDGNCEYTQPQHIAKRLFSARKSISPIIRKRLCKALESDGGCHEEPFKYCGELHSGKQTANEDARVRDPNQIGIQNAICINQKTKKPRNDKKSSPPNENLKVYHLSRAKPSLSSGFDSIQSCSENAIAFSQQQMRDIERIATRLTEELRSMKDIVEERLCSQASPTKFSKYNEDEVKMTIANAKKAEDTTQRWLTMMTKDCKRFCKIMSLTEKASAASGNAVRKERKITFADEAGGKLCHVKIFEDSLASPSEEPSCVQPES